MAAVTDHATAAAAVTAGWTKVQIDRGVAGVQDKNPAPRYCTRFEKLLTGAPGDGGHNTVVEGESTVSAAAADTQALASLNKMRQHYYGGSPGRASGSGDSGGHNGGSHTVDTT